MQNDWDRSPCRARAGSPENLPLYSTFRPEVPLPCRRPKSNSHLISFPAGELFDQFRGARGCVLGDDPATGNPKNGTHHFGG
jgi:hypothetical protein